MWIFILQLRLSSHKFLILFNYFVSKALLNSRQINLTPFQDSHRITFSAMASPCEVIIQTKNVNLAQQLGKIVSNEVWRIEDKYTRYNPRSVCGTINSGAGRFIPIDEETYLLLTFADQCYQLSDGKFDITSGVLRKIWSFDGKTHSDNQFPSKHDINKLLGSIGWNKVIFNSRQVKIEQDMELDFGGVAKEYAVDKCILLAKEITDEPILINFGGDIAVTCSRKNNETWKVAIERPYDDITPPDNADMIISLKTGALATSGDTKRFFIKDGLRYGHVLNPLTGMPVSKAPRSITVAASQCIQAGIFATLALLEGADANNFLTSQNVKYWSRR